MEKKSRLSIAEKEQLNETLLSLEMEDIIYRLKVSEHRYDIFHALDHPKPIEELPKKSKRK